jgi:serine/threonine protein phosphatase PrpC
VRECPLPGIADAVYALLSMVSDKGSQTLEAPRKSTSLQGLSLGHCPGILEFLCVVPGACPARLALWGKENAMSQTADDVLLLDGAIEEHLEQRPMAGGDCIAFTCPAPDKTTGNEDTVAVIPYGPQAVVFVVADGAGGLPAGKRASLAAVTSLVTSLQTAMSETMLLRTAILNGIEAANHAVQAQASGSATTFTVITIEGLHARSYQIGDSQAMVVGQRGLIKLQTAVHSPTGFAVEAGLLDEREALHHEDRHLVSNFLGTADMRIDIGASVKLRPRDTVMLASDGLMDNVHLHEIIERIRCGPLSAAANKLVDLARRRMAVSEGAQPSKPDDLSLILFRKPYQARRQPKSGAAA